MGIKEEALEYIKLNKKQLLAECADPAVYLPSKQPETFLMAGSPGAGKTEWSRVFISLYEERATSAKFIRIDPDEVRERLPMYTGSNSDEVQAAAVVGAQKLFDHALKNSQDLLFDGTFANYRLAKENIERCLKRGRKPVSIIYIHHDPLVAWEITQAREEKEGRSVPRDVFVNAYFTAKDNVNQAKKDFGKDVVIYLIIKDVTVPTFTYKIGINTIDDYLKMQYDSKSLKEKLQ